MSADAPQLHVPLRETIPFRVAVAGGEVAPVLALARREVDLVVVFSDRPGTAAWHPRDYTYDTAELPTTLVRLQRDKAPAMRVAVLVELFHPPLASVDLSAALGAAWTHVVIWVHDWVFRPPAFPALLGPVSPEHWFRAVGWGPAHTNKWRFLACLEAATTRRGRYLFLAHPHAPLEHWQASDKGGDPWPPAMTAYLARQESKKTNP